MKKLLLACSVASLLFNPFVNVAQAHSRDYLPQGSYLKSCNQCSMNDGRNLVCYCPNRKGRAKLTSVFVDRNCGLIENDNGQLHCTGSPPPNPDDGDRHGRRFEVETGILWNQSDAEQRCTLICEQQNGKWTGNWRSIRNGQASICECKKRRRDDGLNINIKL